jgi:hypothetical protein
MTTTHYVREAMNACRASSGGAAGPVPAVAARIRLLFGQMIPQTLSNIKMRKPRRYRLSKSYY